MPALATHVLASAPTAHYSTLLSVEQQRVVRELHTILLDTREDAMRVLCALIVLLGPRFLIFRALVARSLRRAGIEYPDYELLVDRLLKSTVFNFLYTSICRIVLNNRCAVQTQTLGVQ